MPGDDAHAWDGLAAVPHDDLQHWRNPERGFLVTANNRVSDHGPYISLDFAGPSRHNRIVDLLGDRARRLRDNVSEAWYTGDMTVTALVFMAAPISVFPYLVISSLLSGTPVLLWLLVVSGTGSVPCPTK